MKSRRISLTNITTRVSVACVHVYIVELFAGLRCTYMTWQLWYLTKNASILWPEDEDQDHSIKRSFEDVPHTGRSFLGMVIWWICIQQNTIELLVVLPPNPLGQKLRELLIKHGGFKEVELVVSRWSKSLNVEGQDGKWVTKHYLKEVEKFTPYLNCIL